jgi:hypothetical protein
MSAESDRKDMTEWMYGIDAGDAKGSPTDFIGNFRDRVAVRERKKGEIVAGCIRVFESL